MGNVQLIHVYLYVNKIGNYSNMLKTLFQLLMLMIIYMLYMCGRYLIFNVLYKSKDFNFFGVFLVNVI